MNNNRILIIHREGNAFYNPSLHALITYLGEFGYYCDILAQKKNIVQTNLPDASWIFEKPLLRRLKAIAINVLCIGIITRFIVRYQWRNSPKSRYSLIIGIDRQGLIEASYLSQIMQIPYHFISFEIMFEKETFKRFKHLEREASKHVTLWITQDEIRAEKLAQENHLDPLKVFYLPIASRGLGKIGHTRLRDNLLILKEKHVAIAIGSIEKWTMIDDILASLHLWPENWALIVHDRYGFTKKQIADLEKYNSLIGSRLFVSQSTAENIDDMGDILSGVSYGLAFYCTVEGHRYCGDNLKYLGRASGKIATFFRYGIPVIANDIGIMANDIKEYRLGHVVKAPSYIPELLKNTKHLDSIEHSHNCQKYFSSKMDFNLYAEQLVTKMHIYPHK